MAQSVEQLIRNQQVAGSSPASSSKKRRYLCVSSFFIITNLWTDLRVGAVLRERNALPSKDKVDKKAVGKGDN